MTSGLQSELLEELCEKAVATQAWTPAEGRPLRVAYRPHALLDDEAHEGPSC